MTLVVMMSALDEDQSIGQILDAIPQEYDRPVTVKVIVVDDGSSDRTGEIARAKGAIVLRHEKTMGLARSFADGLERALREGADVIVNTDADGQFNPRDIPKLIQPILEGRADFVTATRFAVPELVPEMPGIKKWGNRQMTRLVNFATGSTDFTDVSCGFRAYSLHAALHIHLSGHFTHVQETIIDLVSKGLRVAEVPLKIRGTRQHGNSRMAHSLWHYAFRAGTIVLRTLCRTRPLYFFGIIGGGIISLGLFSGAFAIARSLAGAKPGGIRWFGIAAAIFLALGFLVLMIASVADMLRRSIEISEKVLFYERLDEYRRQRELGRGKS